MANAFTRVEIKDFLVFKGAFAADFCPGVNVLIGGNGSGKTTLLKVLYAATKFSGEYKTIKETYHWKGTFGQVFSNHFEVTPDSYGIVVYSNVRRFASLNDIHRFYVFENDPRVSVNYPQINGYFIPVMNILSHAEGMVEISAKYKMPFDRTELDAFINAGLPEALNLSEANEQLLAELRGVIDGDVININGVYYIKKDNGEIIELNLEADGFGRLGLLWKYLRNGLLEPGSILFWDEPEASINPELVPTLVDILLKLQRNGVQIFVATHSYDVARWFELNKTVDDSLRYFNLRKSGGGIVADIADDYVSLSHSVIDDADSKMLKRIAETAAEKAGVRLK
jgi:energy-coupling factor transporter ATP-binding protein EcfA2